ncbi:hypothetical protein ACLB1G_15795 [Oxalobacteraceae bacterium A2-2]
MGIGLPVDSAPNATTPLYVPRLLEQRNWIKRIFDKINFHASDGSTLRERHHLAILETVSRRPNCCTA